MSAGRHPADAPRFALSTSVIGEAAVGLTVAGELGGTPTGHFEALLRGVLAKPGLNRLVLDFAALRLLDSGSAAVLQVAYRLARRRGITLTATNCRGTVRRTLETAGLYRYLVRDDETRLAERTAGRPGLLQPAE